MGNLSLGDHSYGTIKVIGDGNVKVGKYCSLASGITAIMVGHDHSCVSTFPFNSKYMKQSWPEASHIPGHPLTKGDIEIGNDVWIGMGVTLLSGVSISDGAVIGAGTVVSKDVPPYFIVVGNPQVLINRRFSPEQIMKLRHIKWWDWPEEKVRRWSHMLCTREIDTFINKFCNDND